MMTKEEAMNLVKQVLPCLNIDKKIREAFETLIPELKESEDERIIEEIKFAVMQMPTERQDTKERCIAWLEKQKINTEGDFGRGYDCGYEACLNSHGAEWFEKQKEPHYTKRNALFDKCVENCDPEVMKKVSDEIDEMLQKEQKPFNVCEQCKCPDYNEQKPTEWSEENEKDIAHIIRVLDDCYAYGKHDLSKTDHENLVGTLKSIHPQLKSEWSDEDEGELQNAIDALEFLGKKRVYESESGYDAALKAASWLKSFHPQPKQEWNEEDKLMIKCCLEAINVYKHNAKRAQFLPAQFNIGGYLASPQKVESWLKSLRPQPKREWSKEDVKRLYSIGTEIGFLKGRYSEWQKDIDWLYALAEKMGFHKCKIGEVVTEWKKEGIDDKMLSKPKQEWSEDLEDEISTWIPAHISGGDDEVWRDTKNAVTEWAGIVARHFAEWQKAKMISALKNDGDLPIEFIDKFHEIDRTAFQNGQANIENNERSN